MPGVFRQRFHKIVTRIREAGLVVYGFGERKTPAPFVAACDKFIFTEILRLVPTQEKVGEASALPPLQPMVVAAIEATTREDGWASLAAVGGQISKNNPSFDSRNYGCAKLGELMRKQSYLDVKEVPMSDGSANVHLHVRLAQSAASRAG